MGRAKGAIFFGAEKHDRASWRKGLKRARAFFTISRASRRCKHRRAQNGDAKRELKRAEEARLGFLRIAATACLAFGYEFRCCILFWDFDDDFCAIFLSLLNLLKRVPQVVVVFVNWIARRAELSGKDGDDFGLSSHGSSH
ncbi:hypothetical protein DITRI_Ditri05aG0122100 [Diplodiscus trichospermus]